MIVNIWVYVRFMLATALEKERDRLRINDKERGETWKTNT